MNLNRLIGLVIICLLLPLNTMAVSGTEPNLPNKDSIDD